MKICARFASELRVASRPGSGLRLSTCSLASHQILKVGVGGSPPAGRPTETFGAQRGATLGAAPEPRWRRELAASPTGGRWASGGLRMRLLLRGRRRSAGARAQAARPPLQFGPQLASPVQSEPLRVEIRSTNFRSASASRANRLPSWRDFVSTTTSSINNNKTSKATI